VPSPGAEERAGDALARARKERCRRRDRAGAEECPGAPPAYRLMGWRAGIPPGGRQGGKGKAARDVTATPVDGADLAYLILFASYQFT